jgi:hypothetical protein
MVVFTVAGRTFRTNRPSEFPLGDNASHLNLGGADLKPLSEEQPL